MRTLFPFSKLKKILCIGILGFLLFSFVAQPVFAREYSESVIDHTEDFINDLDSDIETNGDEHVDGSDWTALKETAQNASDAFDAMINSGYVDVDMDGAGDDEAGDDNWDDAIENLTIKDQRGAALLDKYMKAMIAMYKVEVGILDKYPGAEDDDDDARMKLAAFGNLLANAGGSFEDLQPGQQIKDQGGLEGLIDPTGFDLAITDKTGESEIVSGADDSGPIKCGITSGQEVMGCVAWMVYTVLLKGSALLLALVGMIFNMSLNFTLNIGELFLPDAGFGLGGASGAVYVGWSTLRDFINVAFIFVLLYVAIMTILQSDKYGAKKMVTKIVLAAMLLNFSLFFTKAVIDMSNILALQFYARILDAANQANTEGKGDIDGGLSAGILNAVGLSTIWSGGGKSADPATTDADNFSRTLGLGWYKLIVISIFGGMFILILSLVFFIAIIQFFIRTIILLFLMITSPVGFVGEAIPALGGVASEWRKKLTNQAVFAPAYMAILYVVCRIIFGPTKEGIVGDAGFAALFVGRNQQVGSIGIMFWFFLVSGLLITGQAAARTFADKFGSGFVKGAEKWFKGGGFIKTPMKYTGGNALARVGLGKMGQTLSENRFMKKLATTPIIKQLGGQALYDKMRGLKDVKVGGKSYNDAVSARTKRDQATFDALGEMKGMRRGQGFRFGETQAEFEARQNIEKAKIKRAQAKFAGLDIEEKRKMGPHMKTKFGSIDDTEVEFRMTEADIERYKQRNASLFGQGRRKAAGDILKRANPANKKGDADDIAKKIKALEDELKAGKATHDSELTIYQRALDSFMATADGIEVANGRGTPHQIEQWDKLKKALANHKNSRKSDEHNLENLQRQLRQIEAQDKK